MADFIKTPFKERYFNKTSTASDFEGNVKAGGDIEIKGQDVVVMGPAIADEPTDLANILSGLTSQGK